jgi:membrane-bound serine protease (ClpP class)
MKRQPQVWLWTGVVVLMGLAALLPGSVAQAQNATREVVILEASGAVTPPFAGYIARGIDEADRRNAEAVILVLDTPGGNVSVTLDIIQKIRTSDVPVIVFVGPRGAKAASAGLLITLAGHAAAMSPDTAIGASSPVGPQGEDLPSTEQQKMEEYLSAQARSLAERRGEEAVRLANEAVVEARAVSASEALQAHLIDFIAEDVDDLLDQLDGFTVEVGGVSRTLHTSGAVLVPIRMSQLEQVLSILTNPNIVFILLSLGVTAIIVEIRTPGGWAAGTVGVICVGLALYGLGVLPVNWLGIIFILLAFVLFVLEIKAPTHGVLSVAAIISMAVGAIILLNQPEIAPFGRLSIPLVIAQSLLLGGFFFFVVIMALKAQSRRPTTGYEGLVGQIGRVTQDLAPYGMVQVWGERWRAEPADGRPIPAGSQIEVVEAGRMRLRVRRVESEVETSREV